MQYFSEKINAYQGIDRLYEDRWGDERVLGGLLQRLRLPLETPDVTITNTSTNTSAGAGGGASAGAGSADSTNWKEAYKVRAADERREDFEVRVQQLDAAVLEQAVPLIAAFESAPPPTPVAARDGLAQAVRLLAGLLRVAPMHAGAYGLLARAAVARGARGAARELLELGLEVEPQHEQLQAALDMLQQQRGLLCGRGRASGRFERVLRELFGAFDSGRAGTWAGADFDRFVLRTNGRACPPAFRRSVFQSFSTDARGRLLPDGFVEFYLHNALEDPLETWRDLAKHGYKQDLRLKTPPAPAPAEEDDDNDDEDDVESDEEEVEEQEEEEDKDAEEDDEEDEEEEQNENDETEHTATDHIAKSKEASGGATNEK